MKTIEHTIDIAAPDEVPPVQTLTIRQLNRMRVGYLVMGLGLAAADLHRHGRRRTTPDVPQVGRTAGSQHLSK